jgi:hypothetical protein
VLGIAGVVDNDPLPVALVRRNGAPSGFTSQVKQLDAVADLQGQVDD